jgi:hypothetical protein
MRSLLTLSLLLAGCMATAQTITRKAILTKGQRFEQSSAATIDFEMNIMGSIERTQNSGTSTVLITVDKVLDTSYLLKTKLTHKIERAKSSAKNYEFDSGQPANTEHPEEWDRFIKEVGVEKEVIISKRGYSPPGTKRTGNMADAMGILSELKPGDDSNKTNKNYHMVAYLPANRVVKVGDTWADSATSVRAAR